MKQIVICGAGFGGLNCALELARLAPDAAITLIDQKPYHLLHGMLYEVATSDEEFTNISALDQSCAIPISEVIKGTAITFKEGKILEIDAQTKTLVLDHDKVSYDYAVMALGSGSNFYGIPGAEQYSIPLKTLRNALAIRNRVAFIVEAARLSGHQNKLRFIIAGGGLTGVELAGELVGLLDILAWKNNIPRTLMEVVVIEGSPQLMPGLDPRMGRDTYRRLSDLGVIIETKSLIVEVKESTLTLNTGDEYHFDGLFWTAGVAAHTIPITPNPEADRGGRIKTNEYFQIPQANTIFVIGDQGCHLGSDGVPLPGTAPQATDHGRYVANVIASMMQNKTPALYECKDFGAGVLLGGSWGIGMTENTYMTGWLVTWAIKFQWFRYVSNLIGIVPAFKLIFLQQRIYSRNNL